MFAFEKTPTDFFGQFFCVVGLREFSRYALSANGFKPISSDVSLRSLTGLATESSRSFITDLYQTHVSGYAWVNLDPIMYEIVKTRASMVKL